MRSPREPGRRGPSSAARALGLDRFVLLLGRRCSESGCETPQPVSGLPCVRVHTAENEGHIRLQFWLFEGVVNRLDSTDLFRSEHESILLNMAAQLNGRGGAQALG